MTVSGGPGSPGAPRNGSPERDLLWLCLRPGRAAPLLDRARALAAASDGAVLLEAARNEGLSPLLGDLLAAAGDPVPSLAAPLAADRLRAAAVALRTEERFRRALDALEASGVRPLPLKGPVLAALLYDPPLLRDYEDLDLLVREEEAGRAREALAALGWRDALVGDPFDEATHRAEGFVTLRAAEPPDLDLHWRMEKPNFPFPLDAEAWRGGAVPLRVAGREVPSLRPGHLLHYLCVHGSKDLWRRRLWVGDVARALHRFPGVDGAEVASLARGTGTLGFLAFGLRLASRLLEAPLPGGPLRALAEEPGAARAMEAWLSVPFLAPEAPLEDHRRFRFVRSLRERRGHRLRMLAGNVLTPRRTDYDALPLPPWAFPAYRVLRPLRLAWKYARPRAGGAP